MSLNGEINYSCLYDPQEWHGDADSSPSLAQIETHVQHYLSLPPRHKEMLLSPLEIAYANKYDTIRSNHFHGSVLDYLPEELRGLQDDVDASSRGLGGMGALMQSYRVILVDHGPQRLRRVPDLSAC